MKTLSRPPVVCTQAQNQMFEGAFAAAVTIDKLIKAYIQPVVKLVKDEYGDTPPTQEQFWSDRAALKVVALAQGLANDQAVQKPYNIAVRQLYGKLPLALDTPVSTKRKTIIAVLKPSANGKWLETQTRHPGDILHVGTH